MDKSRAFGPDQMWVPEFIADPYPTFRRLRDRTPLRIVALPAGAVAGLDEPVWSWALMKHADVYHALRDHDTFSSVTALTGKLTPRLTLIQDDPPRHSRLRRIVNKTFTPARARPRPSPSTASTDCRWRCAPEATACRATPSAPN